MKFSGKMRLKMILKVTKNQSFTFSLEDAFFEKPQGGFKMAPPLSRFRVNLAILCCFDQRYFSVIKISLLFN